MWKVNDCSHWAWWYTLMYVIYPRKYYAVRISVYYIIGIIEKVTFTQKTGFVFHTFHSVFIGYNFSSQVNSVKVYAPLISTPT